MDIHLLSIIGRVIMIFKAGGWVVLSCITNEAVSLAERKFEHGDRVAVLLRVTLETDGKEDLGGPWGFGGYHSDSIYEWAEKIQDLRDYDIIWEAKNQEAELAPANVLL